MAVSTKVKVYEYAKQLVSLIVWTKVKALVGRRSESVVGFYWYQNSENET